MKTTISIDQIEVDCLIGCLEHERQTVQRIRVDLALDLDTADAARNEALRKTWNYADITGIVTFVLQSGRFYLLETAGHVLVRTLLLPPAPAEERPAVTAARVELTKFGVLPGQARPRVLVSATRDEVAFEVEDKAWGTVDVIDETRLFGVYRLNVDGEIPNHVHRRMRESELVLTDGLVGWQDDGPDQALAVGHAVEWGNDQPHGYRGRGSILCIDTPPFAPSDEVAQPRKERPRG